MGANLLPWNAAARLQARAENCRFWMEGSKHLMARVIEFYIPNHFQKKVAWVPPQRPGQVIEFCPLVKKSA
jgi:hypothetical protein